MYIKMYSTPKIAVPLFPSSLSLVSFLSVLSAESHESLASFRSLSRLALVSSASALVPPSVRSWWPGSSVSISSLESRRASSTFPCLSQLPVLFRGLLRSFHTILSPLGLFLVILSECLLGLDSLPAFVSPGTISELTLV